MKDKSAMPYPTPSAQPQPDPAAAGGYPMATPAFETLVFLTRLGDSTSASPRSLGSAVRFVMEQPGHHHFTIVTEFERLDHAHIQIMGRTALFRDWLDKNP